MRNPVAAECQPGFPFSGSVIAELWLPHTVRPRAAYAFAQSATFKLNWPKMAVPGRNYQADMRFL
jgi:hypothetical protein